MVEYRYDIERNLVLETFRGEIRAEDIIRLKEQESDYGHNKPDIRVLIDIRFADLNFFLSAGDQKINELTRIYTNRQVILVVGSIEQLFNSSGAGLRSVFKNRIKAFTDYNEAIKWIDNK